MTAGGRAPFASSTCTRASSSSTTVGRTPPATEPPWAICSAAALTPRVSRFRSANWLWLPLRCARPRPAFWLYYPVRTTGADEEEEEEEDEDEDKVPPGLCGVQGCFLLNGHAGLCQVRIQGSRREAVKERTMMAEQRQRYHEIQNSKEIQAQVAIARAGTLKKAEDQGVIIKAPRGNRSQWHANFKLDEFTPRVRDVPVVQRDATQATLLRGMLVIGPGHTLADVCKMLLTELQMEPKGIELRLNACASVSAMRPLPHSLRLRARGSWLVESECNLAGGRDSRRTQ